MAPNQLEDRSLASFSFPRPTEIKRSDVLRSGVGGPAYGPGIPPAGNLIPGVGLTRFGRLVSSRPSFGSVSAVGQTDSLCRVFDLADPRMGLWRALLAPSFEQNKTDHIVLPNE